jgi:hypothetical protein
MRNLPRLVIGLVVLCTIMAFTTVERSYIQTEVTSLEFKKREIILPEVKLKTSKLELNLKDHDSFLTAIGLRESSNRYDVVNKFGYMGKYQFGKATLKGLGINVTQDEFINSPYIQEKAMQKLLLHNQKKLRKFINQYEGQVLHGVYITESGVLAAAHLAGAGNVRKFFRRGHEFEDGFGTKMTSYMNKFSGYKLEL